MGSSLRERPVSAAKNRNTYSFRFPAEVVAMVDRAAATSHKDRTEFVLDAMVRAAKEALLDQRLFVLDDVEYQRVVEMIEKPGEPNDALKALARRVPIWDR